ncbi:histidine phosphatase family protein [Pediococcus parvulus]|uniref:histidine phosphatase family protein n=1 Tax=Pediococcus parvulus TaxID=54062 RepID=UPI00345E8549
MLINHIGSVLIKKFTVYLIRHGETYLNKFDRMQGWADAPLTPKGIQDAHMAAEKVQNVHFDQAFSSDLTRAVHTANIILKDTHNDSLDVTQLANIREAFFGYFEGANGPETWDTICRPLGYTGIDDFLSKHTFYEARDAMHAADPFKDAEDAETFKKRILTGIDQLAEKANDGENLLVVSHMDAIRSLIQLLNPQIDVHLPIKNGSLNILNFTDNQAEVVAYDK